MPDETTYLLQARETPITKYSEPAPTKAATTNAYQSTSAAAMEQNPGPEGSTTSAEKKTTFWDKVKPWKTTKPKADTTPVPDLTTR